MTTLHLGVIDIPYNTPPVSANKPKVAAAPKLRKDGRPYKTRARKQGPHREDRHAAGTETTGDVAQILEDKYHVMEVFFHENQQHVADALAQSLLGSLETQMMGGPGLENPLSSGLAEIEEGFKLFIELQVVEESGIPGVPTKAALEGINHRLGIKKGQRRPSFRDTGAYEGSFKAWVD